MGIWVSRREDRACKKRLSSLPGGGLHECCASGSIKRADVGAVVCREGRTRLSIPKPTINTTTISVSGACCNPSIRQALTVRATGRVHVCRTDLLLVRRAQHSNRWSVTFHTCTEIEAEAPSHPNINHLWAQDLSHHLFSLQSSYAPGCRT